MEQAMAGAVDLARRTVALQESVKSMSPNQNWQLVLARADEFDKFLRGEH